jgi:NAD-dependent deacetylase
MATLSMFCLHPFEVWQWYLYRKTVVNRAKPNIGHHAVRALEEIFSDSFCLITQNVDGLHIRAGNSYKRTYQIHGNVNFMRCSNECTSEILPVPSKISEKDKNTPIKEEEKNLLICTYCGKMTRPHVLWFDESYNEKFYRFESSINRAQSTDLLIIVGTSGTTTLPTYILDIAVQKNAAVIDINPEENPFTNIVKSVENGYYIKGKSGDSLLRIVEFLKL